MHSLPIPRRRSTTYTGRHHAISDRRMTDVEREVQIHAAYKSLLRAPDLDGKLAFWHVMRALILGRSPAAVSQLERARGLNRVNS
jgi:hypothetical protein